MMNLETKNENNAITKIVCKITTDCSITHLPGYFSKEEIEKNYHLLFCPLYKLSFWNSFRLSLIDRIEKEFFQMVIEKGLQKETHRTLIHNNYPEFKRFIERKLRYLLNDLVKQHFFDSTITAFNQSILAEIKFNIKQKNSINKNQKQENLIEIINSEIKNQIKNNLALQMLQEIFANDNLKLKIANYVSEFINYLIIF
ncbi:MAG: hypothetical protein FK734_07555 [Asgard group archaeon]|nr:hypothetical protein [Asgard group archaeon]